MARFISRGISKKISHETPRWSRVNPLRSSARQDKAAGPSNFFRFTFRHESWWWWRWCIEKWEKIKGTLCERKIKKYRSRAHSGDLIRRGIRGDRLRSSFAPRKVSLGGLPEKFITRLTLSLNSRVRVTNFRRFSRVELVKCFTKPNNMNLVEKKLIFLF